MMPNTLAYQRQWFKDHPNYHRKWRLKNLDSCRQRGREYLADGRKQIGQLKTNPCTDCHGTFPPECMDFDHVRGIKLREVSKMCNYSVENILAEVAKCDLICANCHRIRTKKRAQT